MWIVTKNGRLAAAFRTKEDAMRHRDSMAQISINLGLLKDKWRIKEVDEDKVQQMR